MLHTKKRQRELLRTLEGLEQQSVYLQEENANVKKENNTLKEDNVKIYRFVKGLEWDIENICIYLEKQQEKDE